MYRNFSERKGREGLPQPREQNTQSSNDLERGQVPCGQRKGRAGEGVQGEARKMGQKDTVRHPGVRSVETGSGEPLPIYQGTFWDGRSGRLLFLAPPVTAPQSSS